jgi:hypothetical protein
MTTVAHRWSPGLKARAAGFFYLLMILIGGLGKFAGGKVFVSNDAAATATNILAHVSLFWTSFAADLLVVASYLVVTALFFELFKPVSRSISLLAAFFSLIGCAIQAFACLFRVAPLVPLSGAKYLSVFRPEQLQALAFMFLKLYSEAYKIGLVFFAFYFVLLGYLIFKSTFLPRTLGVFVALAGLGWLTFLSPPVAGYLWPILLALAGLGEGGLMLWLLVRGVSAERWEEANAAANFHRTAIRPELDMKEREL